MQNNYFHIYNSLNWKQISYGSSLALIHLYQFSLTFKCDDFFSIIISWLSDWYKFNSFQDSCYVMICIKFIEIAILQYALYKLIFPSHIMWKNIVWHENIKTLAYHWRNSILNKWNTCGNRSTLRLQMLSHKIDISNPWRHQMETFSGSLTFERGIHRWPLNSPHQGLWRRAFMFSLICAWTKGWVNNRDASDLRRHHAHYDITVRHHVDSMITGVPGNKAMWWNQNFWTMFKSKLFVSLQNNNPPADSPHKGPVSQSFDFVFVTE